MASKGGKRISRKIRHLKKEGKTQRQAVGQALGMARSGSLGPTRKTKRSKKR